MKKLFLPRVLLFMFTFSACGGEVDTDAIVESVSNIAEDVVESVNDELSETSEENPHWGYSGDIGPSQWASLSDNYALCGNGTTQSPIDLPGGNPTLADVLFDYQETAVKIKNNGHAIQVDYESGKGQISINEQTYELKQFHFHSESEHTVAGEPYSIEMHLVHQNNETEEYAVVAVFIEEGEENNAFTSVWDHLPTEETAESIATGTMINAASLLPSESTVYRYTGSLTTPKCSEGVIWSVLNTPVQMSASQIQSFTDIYAGNNRPTQPIKDHVVQMSAP